MTDEEFYKQAFILYYNTNIALWDLGSKRRANIKLQMVYPELELELDENENLINIKRKLIIKEKSWYLRGNGDKVFIIGVAPRWCITSHPVITISSEGGLNQYTKDGSSRLLFTDSDLIGECTPAEVAEIEEKLRKKNE